LQSRDGEHSPANSPLTSVQDKDREHYLGHSLNAPVGRWQNGKDLTWYNKEGQAGEDERAAEIRKIKEAEEDALAVALCVSRGRSARREL
jgi:hypothetical protein